MKEGRKQKDYCENVFLNEAILSCHGGEKALRRKISNLNVVSWLRHMTQSPNTFS